MQFELGDRRSRAVDLRAAMSAGDDFKNYMEKLKWTQDK